MNDTHKQAMDWVTGQARSGERPTAKQVADKFNLDVTVAMRLRRMGLGVLNADRSRGADPISGVDLRARVYQFISSYVSDELYPPSQREIADRVGVNVQRVNEALAILAEQGLIEYVPGQPRTVRIVGAKMVLPEVTM